MQSREEGRFNDLIALSSVRSGTPSCTPDTRFRYTGEADPSAPGGMATIYRALVAGDARTTQMIIDVAAALERGRHCLLLTQWTAHVERFAE